MRGPGSRPSSAAGNRAQITKHPDGLRCAHLQYGGTTQPLWALGGTNKAVDEEDTRRQESQEVKYLGSGPRSCNSPAQGLSCLLYKKCRSRSQENQLT